MTVSTISPILYRVNVTKFAYGNHSKCSALWLGHYICYRSQTSWIWLEAKLVELEMIGAQRTYEVSDTFGQKLVIYASVQISFGNDHVIDSQSQRLTLMISFG